MGFYKDTKRKINRYKRTKRLEKQATRIEATRERAETRAIYEAERQKHKQSLVRADAIKRGKAAAQDEFKYGKGFMGSMRKFADNTSPPKRQVRQPVHQSSGGKTKKKGRSQKLNTRFFGSGMF